MCGCQQPMWLSCSCGSQGRPSSTLGMTSQRVECNSRCRGGLHEDRRPQRRPGQQRAIKAQPQACCSRPTLCSAPGVEQRRLDHGPRHQQDARHKEDRRKHEESADFEGAQRQLVADLGGVQQRVGCSGSVGEAGSGRVGRAGEADSAVKCWRRQHEQQLCCSAEQEALLQALRACAHAARVGWRQPRKPEVCNAEVGTQARGMQRSAMQANSHKANTARTTVPMRVRLAPVQGRPGWDGGDPLAAATRGPTSS